MLCGARLRWPSVTAMRVGTPAAAQVTADVEVDSRLVRPGSLFVALAGERSDGHDHAAAADAIFSVLMGEDVESRRSFIQRNARDVRFLDV